VRKYLEGRKRTILESDTKGIAGSNGTRENLVDGKNVMLGRETRRRKRG